MCVCVCVYRETALKRPKKVDTVLPREQNCLQFLLTVINKDLNVIIKDVYIITACVFCD